MHETVTEAPQLIALPIRLARTPYALREDDDRLALLKHLHAIERIADHRTDTGQHVAEPWHRRKEALDHRARRARAIRVHRDRAADQHAVQRQLTRMIGRKSTRSSRRDIFDPARDAAQAMVVKQLDDTETELGGVLVITDRKSTSMKSS